MTTYTFGRAFYLMKYGGKTLKSQRTSYRVLGNDLWEFQETLNIWVLSLNIYADEIMGNWEEVFSA
jgi:hypothetical protein